VWRRWDFRSASRTKVTKAVRYRRQLFGRKVVNNLANLLGWLLQFKLDLAYHRHKLIRWLFAKKHFCNPPPIDRLNRGELGNG